MLKKLLNKVWNEQAYFALVPLCFCLSVIFMYHPFYMILDDAYLMRTAAAGTLNPDFGPSEYLLYMSTVYGKILKFLYLSLPGFYWYDILFYLFMSVSVYAISYCLSYDIRNKSVFYKLLVWCVFSPLVMLPFLAPQFTIVSGLLAVSSMAMFYYLANGYASGWKVRAAGIVYMFCGILFSSLVRFEATFVVGLFCGILMLPLLDWKRFKFICLYALVAVASLGAVLTCRYFDQKMIKENPAWNYMTEFNKARVKIHDNTSYEDNIVEPWKNLEDKISNEDFKDAKWNRAYYRMLLSWNFIGDLDVFNPKNLQDVAQKMFEKVSIEQGQFRGFRLSYYAGEFTAYLLVFGLIMLVFPSKKVWRYSFWGAAVFYVLVLLLNMKFRAIPFRLWYNFAAALFIMQFFCINKSGKLVWQPEKWKAAAFMAARILFLGLACLFLVRIVLNYETKGRLMYRTYKHLSKELKNFDKSKVYILNIFTLEHTAFPFKPNIFYQNRLKVMYMPCTMSMEQNLDRIKKYKLAAKDTWKDICSRDDVVYLRLNNGAYYDFYYVTWRKALKYHVKANYNKTVSFIETNKGFYSLFKCSFLNSEENRMRDVLHAVESSQVVDYWKDFMRKKYIGEYLDRHKGIKGIESFNRIYSSDWSEKDEL